MRLLRLYTVRPIEIEDYSLSNSSVPLADELVKPPCSGYHRPVRVNGLSSAKAPQRHPDEPAQLQQLLCFPAVRNYRCSVALQCGPIESAHQRHADLGDGTAPVRGGGYSCGHAGAGRIADRGADLSCGLLPHEGQK